MGSPRVLIPLGAIFGQLQVISDPILDPDHTRFRCRCSCGAEVVVSGSNLRHGITRSCGCWKRSQLRARRLSHGGTKTKLYFVWWTMRQRCQNPNADKYPIYGARGISVCAEWQTFAPFQQWARANGYAEGLQIDRKDNNGNYEPSNCRWATRSQQMRNRRPVSEWRRSPTSGDAHVGG